MSNKQPWQIDDESNEQEEIKEDESPLKEIIQKNTAALSSSLANIKKSSDLKKKAPFILIYGEPGMGKTTLGASMPSPLFIQAESGLRSVSGQKSPFFPGEILDPPALPLVQSCRDLSQYLYDLANEDHKYKTIILDTADAMEPHVIKQVEEKYGLKFNNSNYGREFTMAALVWGNILKRVDKIRDKGIAVVFLCHSAIKRINDPINPEYDRYSIKMMKKPGELLVEHADIIGFYANEIIVDNESGKGKADNTKRLIWVKDRAAALAKNRMGWPESISPIQLIKAMRKMEGGNNK